MDKGLKRNIKLKTKVVKMRYILGDFGVLKKRVYEIKPFFRFFVNEEEKIFILGSNVDVERVWGVCVTEF